MQKWNNKKSEQKGLGWVEINYKENSHDNDLLDGDAKTKYIN